MDDMKGSLKIPRTGEVPATDVTPTQAFDKLTEWRDTKLKGEVGGCGG